MANKPSFFEKLTGASWEEENSKATPKKKKKVTSSKKKQPKKEKEVAFESSEEEKETKTMPKEPTTDQETPESEGQLTVDVYQTPNEVIIKSTIAGVKKEDIDITMSNDMITIKGNREKDEEVSEEDYYYQECYWGPFSRSIILPVDVEVEKAKAGMKNGILTIKLPKVEKVKTKKISIE